MINLNMVGLYYAKIRSLNCQHELSLYDVHRNNVGLDLGLLRHAVE